MTRIRPGAESRAVDAKLFFASRGPKLTIETLRAGIAEFVLNAAYTLGVPPAEVDCPPLEEWGRPPLPQPTRLRLCSPLPQVSIEACVKAEFDHVRNSLPPRHTQLPSSE